MSAHAQLRPQVTPPPTKKAPAKKKPAEAAQIVVQTSPGAHVYLDDVFKGEAGSEGRLVIDSPKPGDHALRVSLQGKRDFVQQVTVVAGQTAQVKAALRDSPGKVVVRTAPGAEVFLDNVSRGRVDPSGELTVAEVTPGWHDVKVSARGKQDWRQNVVVAAGASVEVSAALADSAEAHKERGNALYRKQDFDGAIAEYRQALRLMPDDSGAHNNLGLVLSAKGNYDGAIAEYREAIRLKPDDAEAHYSLGYMLGAVKKDGDGAIAEFREALRLRPDYWQAHANLGIGLYAKKDYDGAIAEYREALRLKPDFPEAHNNLGNALWGKQDFAGAEAEFREGLRLKPNHPEAHYSLGVMLMRKRDFAGAEAQCREAVRLKPDYAEAHFGLGNALWGKQDFAGAEAEFREALRLKPDFPLAQQDLDILLKAKGSAQPEKPAEAAATQIVVQTSPNAQVYLDDVFKGEASSDGRLVIDSPKPGDHALRVSLQGKRDYEKQVRVAAGETTSVQATLTDMAGSIRVQTSPGAEVFLDDSGRGTVGPSGRLVILHVAAGSHQVRVSARGKKDNQQSVTVVAGQESGIEATLADIAADAGAPRENPKDGLKYVYIPPGTFTMGCSPGDSECDSDEKPSHQVTISKGFWLGQTEVTVGAYKRFTASSGRQMPWAPSFNSAWANDNMPIVNVSWDDAQAYCAWTGGRLPTEAEWEYAARGESGEARYGALDEVAWYDKNSGGGTHDVAQKRANAWGLFDTLGNVWEWVNDWYEGNYYQNRPASDPQGPATGTLRVLRGGSWNGLARDVRVSFRARWGNPGGRNVNFGMRCVREVDNP